MVKEVTFLLTIIILFIYHNYLIILIILLGFHYIKRVIFTCSSS